MLQRLIAYSLIIMTTSYAHAATYPTHVHTFELHMDEQLHANTTTPMISDAEQAPQPISAKQILQSTSPTISKTIQTSSAFQLWWLLALPVLFILMGSGWFLGKYMEKRTRIDKKTTPKNKAKEACMNSPYKDKHTIDPKKTPTSETQKENGFHLQTVQTTVPNPKPRMQALPKNKTKHTPAQAFDMLDVHKAYRCFLFTRDEKMLTILEQAFRYDPYDLTPYLMSIRIMSESDRPLPNLKRLLRTGVFLLRTKKPKLWKELSQHGLEHLPDWEDWSKHQVVNVS